jgi:hypothetical protein
MIDLEKLETESNKVLENETKESLTKFIMEKRKKQFQPYEQFEVEHVAFKGTGEGTFNYEFSFNKKLNSEGYFKAIEKALKNQDYVYYLHDKAKWNRENNPTQKEKLVKWWNNLIGKFLIK